MPTILLAFNVYGERACGREWRLQLVSDYLGLFDSAEVRQIAQG
jgi:hypothetical protein